jgi:phage gp46-like protein
MTISDIKLTKNSNGVFDFTVTSGNLTKHEGFDTALQVSLFTDARASASKVVKPERRRGFMGNILNPVQDRQLGGLIWLVEQRRLTQETVNEVVDYAEKSLAWMIEDGIAVDIVVSGDIIPTRGIQLQIDITAIDGTTETRFFKLWELTGV